MRVVEGGRPSEWSVPVGCTGSGNSGEGCRSLPEASAGDLLPTESHALGETLAHVTVRCPVCSVWTDVGGGTCQSRSSSGCPGVPPAPNPSATTRGNHG